MPSKWLDAHCAWLMIAFAAIFVASFAGADGTGQDHGIPAEIAQSPEDFDGTIIELLLTEVAQVISIPLGSNVQLRLTTPEPTELHLHGYDLSVAAGPQMVAVMTFHAEHAGRFAIVSHGGDDLLGRGEKSLAYIEVVPE